MGKIDFDALRQHPATESHFAAIAAAIAYNDLAQT